MRVVRNTQWHARFLNTLSLMELCGAQKLSSLLRSEPSSTFLLEHVAEEYRHAYFLRRLANKLGNKNFTSFDETQVFAKSESIRYINHLDRYISLELRSFPKKSRLRLLYLLTTAAIEQRALPFYRMYQEILDEENLCLSVKSIISEEEHHLASITNAIAIEKLPEDLLRTSCAFEHDLFTRWLNAIADDLNKIERHSLLKLAYSREYLSTS
jgi:rubrerythrin